MSAWETLVERYKGDRRVCNCRQAWYARPDGKIRVPPNPRQYKGGPSIGVFADQGVCAGGCGANIVACREEIAKRVLDELPAPFDWAALAEVRKTDAY